jgi:5-methylcytosine-specific restriction endonuclease McrA
MTMAELNPGFISEPSDVDADIIAAAVGQLLQRRDGEAALTLATLPRLDSMPRSEAKGTQRMVMPRQRVPLTKVEMARIYIRDGWRCRYCGRKLVFPYVLELLRTLCPGFKGLLEGHHMPFVETEPAVERVYPNVDHVEPRLHAPENLVTACTPCNTRKGNWLGWPRPGPITHERWDGLWLSHLALIEQRRADLSLRPSERQWAAALLLADDPAKADDGKTAMQRYAEFHSRNCNCEPADAAHDDGAQDNIHTDDAAEARRDNQKRD